MPDQIKFNRIQQKYIDKAAPSPSGESAAEPRFNAIQRKYLEWVLPQDKEEEPAAEVNAVMDVLPDEVKERLRSAEPPKLRPETLPARGEPTHPTWPTHTGAHGESLRRRKNKKGQS